MPMIMSRPMSTALATIIDMEAIAAAGLEDRGGPDGRGERWPTGSRSPSSTAWTLRSSTRNVDPTFAFMTVDKDGKIRMDCSSPYAMASLIGLKDRYDIAFGNDPDSDRHGIVTPQRGAAEPEPLPRRRDLITCSQNRPGWRADAAVGKTLVSSAMIDRVAASLGRPLAEVPVGFKWFVDGLLERHLRLRRRGKRRGLVPAPGRHRLDDRQRRHYSQTCWRRRSRPRRAAIPASITHDLEARFGSPVYERMDAPATPAQQAVLVELCRRSR